MANARQDQNNGQRISPGLQSSGHDLEQALSSLSLYPAPAPTFSPVNGDGYFPYGRRQVANNLSDISLQNLRFQLGQMGSGVGPRNPVVGPDVFPMYGPPAPPPPATLFNNYPNYPSGMLYSNELINAQYSRLLYDVNNLNRKKQMDLYRVHNAQIAQPPVFQNGGGAGSNAHRRPNNRLVQQFDLLTLRDMKGGIVGYAMDQHWCRVLQAKFVDPSQEDIEMVLSEVIDCVDELMKNPFGNYLVQNLIAVCNEEQRNRIILSVTKNTFQLVNICCNPHGYVFVEITH